MNFQWDRESVSGVYGPCRLRIDEALRMVQPQAFGAGVWREALQSFARLFAILLISLRPWMAYGSTA